METAVDRIPKQAWRGTALLILPMTMMASAGPWRALPSLPEGCGNFVSGSVGADLVLLGGITWRDGVKTWRDTLWRFDSTKEQWHDVGKLPHPLAYAAFGPAGDGLAYVGGSDGKITQSGVVLLNRNLQWQKLADLAQPLVYSGCAVAHGKLFVVCGAADATNLGTVTNSFYAVDLRTGKAESLPAYPGGAVMLPATAAIDGRLFVFAGGRVSPENQVQNTDAAFVYSIDKRKWMPLKPYPMAVRGVAACALDQRHILLGGGFQEGFIDDQFIYDTQTAAYFRAPPLPYRAMASYLRAGDDLYWIGGEDKMKHRSEAFYRTSWKDLLAEALAKRQ